MVGMTVAVGVGVGTVAGVIIGLMLALGVGLFPGLTGCLLAVAITGVGLMLAVGGSEVLALIMKMEINNDSTGLKVHFKEAPSKLINTDSIVLFPKIKIYITATEAFVDMRAKFKGILCHCNL